MTDTEEPRLDYRGQLVLSLRFMRALGRIDVWTPERFGDCMLWCRRPDAEELRAEVIAAVSGHIRARQMWLNEYGYYERVITRATQVAREADPTRVHRQAPLDARNSAHLACVAMMVRTFISGDTFDAVTEHFRDVIEQVEHDEGPIPRRPPPPYPRRNARRT